MNNAEKSQHALNLLKFVRISQELKSIKQRLEQITKQKEAIVNRKTKLEGELSQVDRALKAKKLFDILSGLKGK